MGKKLQAITKGCVYAHMKPVHRSVVKFLWLYFCAQAQSHGAYLQALEELV